MSIKSFEFQVAIRRHHNTFLYQDKKHLQDFILIKNPLLYWLADPFVVEINGLHYLFVEAANRITGKGKLIYTILESKSLNRCKWKKCLKEKYHLSFPNLFIDNDYLKMIPETHQNSCISVYESSLNKKTFNNWSIDKTYVSNIECVDTIFLKNYLITYNISNPHYRLELYSLDGKCLFSCFDTELTLRPAGKILYNNNHTIYVSQNCKHGYGSGIIFNYIDISRRTIYLKPFLQIDYNDLNIVFNNNIYNGIHTYNKDSEYEVVDIKLTKFNAFGFIGKCYNKIKSLLCGVNKDNN